MTSEDLINRFARQAPVALQIRGLLDFAFAPAFLNPLAEAAQETTYTRAIAFAHLVALLSEVVFRVHPSVRAAYRHNDALQAVAGLKCFYEKLNHTEPAVAAAFVAGVADRVAPLVGAPVAAEPLAGLRLCILDGNHLAASPRRLDGLEDVPAPLPGQALVLLEHASGLFRQVLPWEDAHAKERKLHASVLPWFAAGDCVVADSIFCSEEFLRGLIASCCGERRACREATAWHKCSSGWSNTRPASISPSTPKAHAARRNPAPAEARSASRPMRPPHASWKNASGSPRHRDRGSHH